MIEALSRVFIRMRALFQSIFTVYHSLVLQISSDWVGFQAAHLVGPVSFNFVCLEIDFVNFQVTIYKAHKFKRKEYVIVVTKCSIPK